MAGYFPSLLFSIRILRINSLAGETGETLKKNTGKPGFNAIFGVDNSNTRMA